MRQDDFEIFHYNDAPPGPARPTATISTSCIACCTEGIDYIVEGLRYPLGPGS